VFRKAMLYFSVSGGSTYQEHPIVFEFMRDTLIEFARNVIVPIPNRIGRFIKVELYFDSRWMMISEVRFESGTSVNVMLGYVRAMLRHVMCMICYAVLGVYFVFIRFS